VPRWPANDEDTKHRSVSQLNSYRRCPYAWFLKRIQEAPSRPAAWLPMGTALHTAIEAVEKENLTLDQAVELAESEFVDSVNEMCEEQPHWEQWFSSGRYAGAQDVERRFALLKSHLENYFSYRTSEVGSEDVIWIDPDGKPGIELDFDVDVDGVRVKGFIDQVLTIAPDVLHVRDVKSGAAPADDLQLGVYKVALEECYPGVEAPSGDFLLTKSGSVTFPYDLGEYTFDRIAEMFRELEDNIQAERFDPKPSPQVCRRCDVASSCPFAE
jgi:RecB family exonuclease